MLLTSVYLSRALSLAPCPFLARCITGAETASARVLYSRVGSIPPAKRQDLLWRTPPCHS